MANFIVSVKMCKADKQRGAMGCVAGPPWDLGQQQDFTWQWGYNHHQQPAAVSPRKFLSGQLWK